MRDHQPRSGLAGPVARGNRGAFAQAEIEESSSHVAWSASTTDPRADPP